MIDRLLRKLRIGSVDAAPADTPSGPDAEALDWTRLRRPMHDHDRVMQSETHVWLRRVPSAIHPKHLCRYHPRIANRLAQCWGDKEKVEQLIDELLVDRRGHRKGFSERVKMELERLERFHARRLHVSYPPLLVVRPRRGPVSGGGGG